MNDLPVRRFPAIVGAAALLAASLAGCTALPGTGGCTPAYASGDASSIVTAEGAAGSSPDVDFPTPLIASSPQVTRVVQGEGAAVRDGSQVDYSLSYYSGATGELQAEFGYGAPTSDDPPRRTQVGLDDVAISRALSCASVGDRLVLTASAADAFGQVDGEQGTLVLVIDVLAQYLGKADGFNQLPQDGLPVVVTEVDGTPAIAIGTLEKPTVTRVETVKGGSGAAAREDDRVVVHLRAWTWPEGAASEPTEFASTWGSSSQAAYTMTFDDELVPPGVRDAILGSKVGSQLLVVIPPGDDSYPTPPNGLTADSTMVWVVDVLGIQK